MAQDDVVCLLLPKMSKASASYGDSSRTGEQPWQLCSGCSMCCGISAAEHYRGRRFQHCLDNNLGQTKQELYSPRTLLDAPVNSMV